MRRFLTVFLVFFFLPLSAFIIPSAVEGQTTQSATESASVTATVPSQDSAEPDSPTLISPANNSTIGTTAPTFIFDPSLGAVVVTHYQLWIDGNKNTDHIPAYNLTITTNALTALTEGNHTWFIKAIGSNGQNRNSATWTFTIDTTAPSLVLDSVAGQTYTNQAQITTNQKSPEFVGRSDTGAAITISLSGTSLSLSLDGVVGSDGKFSLKPGIALPQDSYTVSISATDTPGNSTALPSFTLTVSSFASGFTIDLPSPLPDLSFTLPFLTGSLIPEGLTAFPILTAVPASSYLLWLVLILLLIHLYQVHRHFHDQNIYLYIFLLTAIILLVLTISGIIRV